MFTSVFELMFVMVFKLQFVMAFDQLVFAKASETVSEVVSSSESGIV